MKWIIDKLYDLFVLVTIYIIVLFLWISEWVKKLFIHMRY